MTDTKNSRFIYRRNIITNLSGITDVTQIEPKYFSLGYIRFHTLPLDTKHSYATVNRGKKSVNNKEMPTIKDMHVWKIYLRLWIKSYKHAITFTAPANLHSEVPKIKIFFEPLNVNR